MHAHQRPIRAGLEKILHTDQRPIRAGFGAYIVKLAMLIYLTNLNMFNN